MAGTPDSAAAQQAMAFSAGWLSYDGGVGMGNAAKSEEVLAELKEMLHTLTGRYGEVEMMAGSTRRAKFDVGMSAKASHGEDSAVSPRAGVYEWSTALPTEEALTSQSGSSSSCDMPFRPEAATGVQDPPSPDSDEAATATAAQPAAPHAAGEGGAAVGPQPPQLPQAAALDVALRRADDAAAAAAAAAAAGAAPPQGRLPRPGPRGMTTLMVRNIPVLYTQAMLLQTWDSRRSYDFLYLPKEATSELNLSYAFVNFVSEEAALAFKARYHKTRMARFRSRKMLNVGFANLQGLRANVLQFVKKSQYMTDTRGGQPVIIAGGTGRYLTPHQALDQGVV